MPLYQYICEETGEIKDLIQGMNEPHVFEPKDGKVWKRLFGVPEAAIDSKWDALSSKKFVEMSGKKKGTMKDIWSKSGELSQERVRIMGKDPLREKFKSDWSKERNNRPFPPQLEAKLNS